MRVAVLDDIHQVAETSPALNRLRQSAELTIFAEPAASEADAARRLTGFQAVIPIRERTRFTRSLLEALPGLELIAQTGAGVAHVDLTAATERGIAVANTPGASNAAVAELTLWMILSLLRGFGRVDQAIGQGRWSPWVAREVRGKVLGIVGLGAIGREVARLGQAFGMQVMAWGPTLTPERAALAPVRSVTRETLFSEADVVSLHLRLTDATRRLIGAADLSRMRRMAFLVNTARADLVDEAALVRALQGGRIAGAALDVFWEEPLPADHPLRRLPNVLLTPHIGWLTVETYEAFFCGAVENILNYIAGRPTNVLNPEAFERRRA